MLLPLSREILQKKRVIILPIVVDIGNSYSITNKKSGKYQVNQSNLKIERIVFKTKIS